MGSLMAKLMNSRLTLALAIVLSAWSAQLWAQADKVQADEAQTDEAPAESEPLQETQLSESDEASESAQSEPVPVPASYSNLYQRDLQLKYQQLKGQAHWLDTGVEQVLAAWQEDASGSPQGAALIIVRPERAPLWEAGLEHLRNQLPEHGWATLTLVVPAKPPLAIPARPEPEVSDGSELSGEPLDNQATEAAPEGASEAYDESNKAARPESEEIYDDATGDLADANPEDAAKSDAEPAQGAGSEGGAKPRIANHAAVRPALESSIDERTQMALNAGAAFLKEKGQFHIAIIDNGELAGQAKMALGDTALAAHILVSGEGQLTDVNALANSMLGADVPTLDLYFQLSQYRAKPLAQVRKREAKVEGYQVFRQYIDINADAEQLTRRVRGFLKRYAKGMEVN